MPEVSSTMLPLGTIAPGFNLINTINDQHCALEQCKSEIATVIVFICNHCPYVKLLISELVNVANTYQAQGISFIAISSNDVTQFPEDGPSEMQKFAQQHQLPFPYLYDSTQEVAKAYHAACTPDFYIFDAKMSCVYRGRFDEATPGNGKPVTGHDLRNALDSLLAHKAITAQQYPSLGCNIKWR